MFNTCGRGPSQFIFLYGHSSLVNVTDNCGCCVSYRKKLRTEMAQAKSRCLSLVHIGLLIAVVLLGEGLLLLGLIMDLSGLLSTNWFSELALIDRN